MTAIEKKNNEKLEGNLKLKKLGNRRIKKSSTFVEMTSNKKLLDLGDDEDETGLAIPFGMPQ